MDHEHRHACIVHAVDASRRVRAADSVPARVGLFLLLLAPFPNMGLRLPDMVLRLPRRASTSLIWSSASLMRQVGLLLFLLVPHRLDHRHHWRHG